MNQDSSTPAVRVAIALASICLLAFAVPALAQEPTGGGYPAPPGGQEGKLPPPPGGDQGQLPTKPKPPAGEGEGQGEGSGKCKSGEGTDDSQGDESKKTPKVALPHPPSGENEGAGGGTGKAPCGGDFKRGFLKRVWKFGAEVDSYGDGVLNVTIEKVFNLPKKFKDQDDPILDVDADVLVGETTRVTKDGETVDPSALADAEHVRVKGKLLRRSKWNEDEDGEHVPTIRAKKIAID